MDYEIKDTYQRAMSSYFANVKKPNADETIALFQAAMQEGNKDAYFFLGNCYLHAIGTEKDLQKARQLFLEGIKNSNAKCCFAWADCYLKGEVIAHNSEQSEKLFCLAIPYLLHEAQSGDMVSQFLIGCSYLFDGHGVAKNQEDAVKWFQMSAKSGYVAAQVNLAKCYEEGLGVVQNLKEAENWYQQASEQGNADAAYKLALIYLQDVEFFSVEEALRLLQRAANQGHVAAASLLGVCYEKGRGVEKNIELAVHWYQFAAEYANADALCNMGLCYENARGVLKNDTQAIECYKKAAEMGHVLAEKCLGMCYYQGIGTLKRFEQARYWLQLSADAGNEQAKDLLFQLGNVES